MAHITLSQLTTVLQRIVSWATGKFAAKNTYSGKIEYADMPVVVLASMGSELDGTSTQRPMSAGSTYYLPAEQGAGARIMFVDSNGTAVKISDPESNVIYCNAYTGLLYRWDESESDMVPVGGDVDGLRKVYVGNNDFSSLDTLYSGVYQVIEQSTQRIIGVLAASSDNKFGANPYFVTQWFFSNLMLSDEYSGSFNGYYTNGRAHIIHRFYNASNSSSDIPLNTWTEWKVYGLTLDELNVLSEAINTKANDADVVKGIKDSNGNTLPKSNGIVTLPESQGGLTKEDISVETQGDGMVNINVKDDTYTINLNHTHEGMAKLVVDTAANLPDASEMDSDTIYGELDDGEIATIYLGGYPFYGGGASNTPVLRDPSNETTIQMGAVENGSVTKSIKVKGKGLTQALTIELGGTGYTFGSTQPSSVTRVSNTELSIAAADIAAVNALNGIIINVVYTGSADNATGTLSITSGSPDNVSTEVTLIANVLDTDGLVGLWNSADAVQSGAWVDRINGMKLNLGGNAAKVSDGYQINNLSSVRNAWLYLDGSNLTLMNTEIDEVFTCVVDCLVKFSAANMMAEIIDFGGLGLQLSDVTLRVYATQDGLLKNAVKYNNQLLTPYEQDKNIGAFTLNTYVPLRLVCGARYSSDGTMQLLYGIVNSQQVSSVITPPVTINFRGCYVPETGGQQTTLPYAFGMGLLYYTNNADIDLPSYKADIIYKRVLLYNKIKTL